MDIAELQKKLEDQQVQIDEMKRQLGFFSSIIDMSVILSSTFDLDELLKRVIETSQRVMESEASSVMLINSETGLLECRIALGNVGDKLRSGFTLEVGQGIAGWVAENGKSVVVNDVENDKRFFKGVDNNTGFKTRAILASPLIVQGKVIGVAEVLNPKDNDGFDDNDRRLFETFCLGAATAVQNAQMHQRLLHNERVEQQLQMASIIQQGFLPRRFSLGDGNGRYEIAARNLPASLVGGDLYDCIELRENLLGITIGDVSGKGVPAALYMARLISDFRFYAHQAEDPVPTMEILNEMLTDRSSQGMFVTMIYMTLDIEKGELNWINSGHLSPILYRRRGNEIVDLGEGKSIPLGIQNPVTMSQTTIILEPEDTLILCTDGVYDAKNKNGNSFSRQQMEDVIRGRWERAEDLVGNIVDSVKEHSNGMRQFDDITTMVLSWH